MSSKELPVLADINIKDNILFVVFNEKNADFDEEEAHRQVNRCMELTQKKDMPVIIDTTNSHQTPTVEAKKILTEFPFKVSEAIIVKYLHQRLTSTFFLKLSSDKGNHPVKIFTSFDKALEWTKQFTS